MIKLIKSLLQKDQHYFFAISMGLDSVAAFLFLKSKGYNLTPLHFNHNLRPQNNLMQQKFEEFCSFFQLKGFSSNAYGLKTEVECRNARLQFFSQFAANQTVITAHHLNDWVESYLLNCLRGQPNHQPFTLQSQFSNFTIVHPFLLTRKSNFHQYLERNNWLHFIVEDETNRITEGSRRNWIRNHLIPEMYSQKISLEKFAFKSICTLVEQMENTHV